MSDENTSVVQTPRTPYDIAKQSLQTEFEKFLENPTTQVVEALTGALSLGAKYGVVAVGHIAQAALKGKIYEQLAEEWKTLREAGKIPENLGETKHGLYTWAELMKIIDDECPDSDRLDALKAAFYAVNKINSSDADQILSYQLWQIAKKLISGDVILLRTLFQEIDQIPSDAPIRRTVSEYIAQKSGFQYLGLLDAHFNNLDNLFLVNASARATYMKTAPQSNYLTDLGLKFCQSIDEFEFDLLQANEKK